MGTASAYLNGKPWIANETLAQPNEPCYKGRLGLELTKQGLRGLEIFGFSNITLSTGVYQVYPAVSGNPCKDTLIYTSFAALIGDDVLKDFYVSLAGAKNTLEITSISKKKKRTEVIGNFNVTYVIFDKKGSLYPDTIKVTDGYFRARIGK
ncbi:hypothetical protein GCM10007390_42770 [Persicitalea jodogahamensis]|uniref:Uncharacterized protein n=1 Tax=Persicitalea jodogahamensis TaxID=402147 RepID=A0A8J3GBN8_9BACT|nr:hypothetical protein GCM10007390_42770 [Persicitalea jodogahamensis]